MSPGRVDARRVVVVGGGISGLAAAHRLIKSSNGLPIDVVVLEASDAVGGKLRTIDLGGLPIEAGADSFVVRKPWAVELCQEVGLGGDLVIPGATGASVWTRERLAPFPASTAFGIPSSVGYLLRWPGLSVPSRLRALLDLWKPARAVQDDESLGDLVTRRLGSGALKALVAPLLAGLHAGDPNRLSIEATFPELANWERTHGSLIRGARAALKGSARPPEGTTWDAEHATAAARGPMFATVWGGLSRLVRALQDALGGDRLKTGSPVSAMGREGRRFQVSVGEEHLDADAVILATPAFESARLLLSVNGAASQLLGAIPYASSAVVALVYPEGTAERLPQATGVVVAGGSLTINAATWLSRKWPDDRYGDRAVVRCFVGRAGDERALDLTDDELAERASQEVDRVASLGARPSAWRVIRWTRSMPQYEVGHLERVAKIERSLEETPGVFVTGSSYRGVGIADCIRQANETATTVRAYLHRASAPAARPAGVEKEAIQWTS